MPLVPGALSKVECGGPPAVPTTKTEKRRHSLFLARLVVVRFFSPRAEKMLSMNATTTTTTTATASTTAATAPRSDMKKVQQQQHQQQQPVKKTASVEPTTTATPTPTATTTNPYVLLLAKRLRTLKKRLVSGLRCAVCGVPYVHAHGTHGSTPHTPRPPHPPVPRPTPTPHDPVTFLPRPRLVPTLALSHSTSAVHHHRHHPSNQLTTPPHHHHHPLAKQSRVEKCEEDIVAGQKDKLNEDQLLAVEKKAYVSGRMDAVTEGGLITEGMTKLTHASTFSYLVVNHCSEVVATIKELEELLKQMEDKDVEVSACGAAVRGCSRGVTVCLSLRVRVSPLPLTLRMLPTR